MAPGYKWHTECIDLVAQHWMDYTDFLKLMNSFKFKAFSRKAVREQILTTLDNLESRPPFSPSKRFPEDSLYINLNHSVPSKYLERLASCLDSNDRQQEKGRTDHVNDERAFSNMEDAKVCFYTTIRSILDMTGSLAVEDMHIFGIYTQTTFEAVNRLVWSTS